MGLPGSDHEVVRLSLLQHRVHRAYVIFGMTPITLRVEIADSEFVRLCGMMQGWPNVDALGPFAAMPAP